MYSMEREKEPLPLHVSKDALPACPPARLSAVHFFPPLPTYEEQTPER
jgi:hypothetical protein